MPEEPETITCFELGISKMSGLLASASLGSARGVFDSVLTRVMRDVMNGPHRHMYVPNVLG